jgi:hypothetical protein
VSGIICSSLPTLRRLIHAGGDSKNRSHGYNGYGSNAAGAIDVERSEGNYARMWSSSGTKKHAHSLSDASRMSSRDPVLDGSASELDKFGSGSTPTDEKPLRQSGGRVAYSNGAFAMAGQPMRGGHARGPSDSQTSVDTPPLGLEPGTRTVITANSKQREAAAPPPSYRPNRSDPTWGIAVQREVVQNSTRMSRMS